jgi:hypothetical protein
VIPGTEWGQSKFALTPFDSTPGMSVTVEVKTGTRRVIEFFLAPLLRYRQESIRER